MKYLITIFLLTLLVACHNSSKPLLSQYLHTGNLPQQSFIINPDADTTLTSSGGVRIKIRKGTFSSGKPVTIEWKEALDFQSILKAGLTTQTGKEILRSGGMFYFNTVESLKIQKPIDIDVPTENIASGMQLYKGDSSNGKLDWRDPKPIENVKAFGENALGKTLFQNNCASCHRVDKDLTGPSLVNFQKRGPWRDKEKYYAWMYNPAGFMATDYYTQMLKCKYGVVMPAFPGLSNEALDSIAAYINEETERLGLTQMNYDNSVDSCVYYRLIYDSLVKNRDSLQSINNNTIDIEYNLPPKPPPFTGVIPLERNSDYYHVTIDAIGWYNVDALVEGMNGAVKSKLTVRLKGNNSDKQEFYLAIPSINVVGQGGFLENGIDIGFYDLNGSIPLPQGAKAFVFAIGEKKGKFFYSRKDFITSRNQTIYLGAETLTKEQFDLKLKGLMQQGLPTTSDTTDQYNNLKTVDEKLEKIWSEKLKNCGCMDSYISDFNSNK